MGPYFWANVIELKFLFEGIVFIYVGMEECKLPYALALKTKHPLSVVEHSEFTSLSQVGDHILDIILKKLRSTTNTCGGQT